MRLGSSGGPYALASGDAVALLVSKPDESAVRNTQGVDILFRREGLERATEALAASGFIRNTGDGVTMFMDGSDAKARDAVHVVFANEKVRPNYEFSAPDVDGRSLKAGCFRVVPLKDLVQMKLNSDRGKDRTHIRDLIFVGLVNSLWPDILPATLADRLRRILENQDG